MGIGKKIVKAVAEIATNNAPECGATAGGRRCTKSRKGNMAGCSVEHANFNAMFKDGWLR